MLRSALVSNQLMVKRNIFSWFKPKQVPPNQLEERLMKQNREKPTDAISRSNLRSAPSCSWIDTVDTKDLSHNFVALGLFVTAYEKNKDTMALMRTLVDMEHLQDINGDHIFGKKISFGEIVNSVAKKLFDRNALTLREYFFYNEVIPGYRTVNVQSMQRLLRLQKTLSPEERNNEEFLINIYDRYEQYIADDFNLLHQTSAEACIEDLLKKKELFDARFDGYDFHLTPTQCKMTLDQYRKDLETFKPSIGFRLIKCGRFHISD